MSVGEQSAVPHSSTPNSSGAKPYQWQNKMKRRWSFTQTPFTVGCHVMDTHFDNEIQKSFGKKNTQQKQKQNNNNNNNNNNNKRIYASNVYFATRQQQFTKLQIEVIRKSSSKNVDASVGVALYDITCFWCFFFLFPISAFGGFSLCFLLLVCVS